MYSASKQVMERRTWWSGVASFVYLCLETSSCRMMYFYGTRNTQSNFLNVCNTQTKWVLWTNSLFKQVLDWRILLYLIFSSPCTYLPLISCADMDLPFVEFSSSLSLMFIHPLVILLYLDKHCLFSFVGWNSMLKMYSSHTS